tara:strand:+ start:243 stop:476 length:234 start_codon:yes stop_codon:yes gene_type:complete
MLKLVEDKKIELFGKDILGKTISLTNHKVDWLNSECWNKNFDTITDDNITYKNIKFKRSEFSQIIKEVRSEFLKKYS